MLLLRRCTPQRWGAQRRWSAVSAWTDRDVCVRVLSADRRLRVVVANTRNAWGEALRRRQVTDPADAALLGRTLNLSVMLASLQGTEERLHVDLDSTADTAGVACEAVGNGEVRGHVRQRLAAPPQQPPCFCVRRILYNHSAPVRSATPLIGADLDEEAEEHLLRSSGMPVAVATSAVTEDAGDGLAAAACVGVLVEPMPADGGAPSCTATASADLISGVRSHLRALPLHALGRRAEGLPTAARVLAEVVAPDHRAPVPAENPPCHDTMHALLSSLRLLPRGLEPPAAGGVVSVPAAGAVCARVPVDFHCRCSLDSFSTGLQMLGADTVKQLRSEQPSCELTCQHCGKVHVMTAEAWNSVEQSLTG